MQTINLYLSLVGSRERIPKALSKLQKERTELYNDLSDLDKEQNNILHLIEINMDAVQMVVLMKELSRIRKERRDIKGQILITSFLIENPDKSLTKLKNYINTTKGRRQGWEYLNQEKLKDLCECLIKG